MPLRTTPARMTATTRTRRSPWPPGVEAEGVRARPGWDAAQLPQGGDVGRAPAEPGGAVRGGRFGADALLAALGVRDRLDDRAHRPRPRWARHLRVHGLQAGQPRVLLSQL